MIRPPVSPPFSTDLFTSLARERWIVTLFVVLSRGLTLLNDGIYWDDWPELFDPAVAVWQEFLELGMWFKALVHLLLDRPLTYQAVKFVSFLLTAHLVISILRWVERELWPGMTVFLRVTITSVLVLFPSNAAQVSLTFAPVFATLLFFFLGFWLLLGATRERRLWPRLLALTAFFVSFQTESLLVLYALPVAVLLLATRDRRLSDSLRNWGRFTDFLLLPIGYWILKLIAFGPRGRFATYNAVQFPAMLDSPRYVWAAFKTSVMEAAAPFATGSIVALMLLGLVCFLALRGVKATPIRVRQAAWGLPSGAVLFYLCVFSYIAAGHGPVFEYERLEWYTRNEVLIPVAASILVTFGIGAILSLFRSAVVLQAGLSLLLGGFLLAQIQNCLEFQRDWFKQLAIIGYLTDHSGLRERSPIVFEDRTQQLNAMGRVYRAYEVDHLFRMAYDDRMPRAFKTLTWAEYIDELRASAHATDAARPEYVRVDFGTRAVTIGETAALLRAQYSDANAFRERVRDVVTVVSIPIATVPRTGTDASTYGNERLAFLSTHRMPTP